MDRNTFACAGLLSLSIVAAAALISGRVTAGPLDPPVGTIAPTYKTLAEIEPRIAINSVNTPGDADSTWKITQPGSYYLTGNLTAATSKSAIEIAASHVTIDLNGFAITDTVGSELYGIFTSTPTTGIVIRDGSVRAFDRDGINLTIGGTNSFSRIENVTTRDQIRHGMVVGGSASVSEVIASDNGVTGMIVGAGSVVRSCTAYENLGTGIDGGGGNTTVIDCVASTNGGTGITVGTGGRVESCSAYLNSDDGIRAGDHAVVRGCAARNNGLTGILAGGSSEIEDCSVILSGLDGISAGAGSVVGGNTSDSNGGSIAAVSAGIVITGIRAVVRDNNCTDNEVGIRTLFGEGVYLANMCTGNTVNNWEIAAGNAALVVNSVNAGAITGSAGGVDPGSSNPAANFTY
jgi:hypothetical protein